MAIRVSLNHRTIYAYDRPVFFGPHVIRLRPAPHCRTPILAYSQRVEPAGHFLNWQQDPFGNWQARAVFPKPSRAISVEVDLIAELTTQNPFDFFVDEYAERFPFDYAPGLAAELAPYRARLECGATFQSLLARIERDIVRDVVRPVAKPRTIDVLVGVNQLICGLLRYDIRMEAGVFAPDETLERGHGSCRDFAWLMVQLLRHLGFGARFVSGYSIQLVPDQKPLEGPAGVARDCTDLHAWAEVYLPGAGWIGFDATSGLLAAEGHIPLACTPEPSAAAPISGTFGWHRDHEGDKLNDSFEVSMTVERIEDRPRATRPYSDEQRRAIEEAGDRVERVLVEEDVRLTLGGEPTFVSIDDMAGAEWNTAALGADKEKLAAALLLRLREKFAHGGLLHHGQGKWYPGEPLPRWAYSCFFRTDGAPVWTDATLFADGHGREGLGPKQAAAFTTQLAERLGVDAGFVIPAHEDVWYYLWRERRLPTNVDPFDARLDDERERRRLQGVFESGLASVVGYALPLAPVSDDGRGVAWSSGRWFLRAERMYLIPGDSPMGYRLPLDSLPWSAPGDRPDVAPLDPTAPRTPLAPRTEWIQQVRPGSGVAVGPSAAGEPARFASATGIVATALCVEPRGGTLHVFMPPVPTLEAYLNLVANIEETARALHFPVRLEGYLPPVDHRLQKFQITPDPGVIEVNVHPAATWREVVDRTRILYEEARQCRLGTEKFMLDGRHTGTGGGNHITLGGPTPNDSPILRRPDVLRSLIAYFVDHPSLSYLFSGLFIGPTSQAPRVDEARHDALDELDIALAQIRSPQDSVGDTTHDRPTPPWLVDRLLRHLLVDLTGNTHRTEICIDKLYSPDSAAGRLGLVELRGFEMPPEAHMNLAEQLLVRALVAHFWRRPYRRVPVRWGTALHDRFMLPHFLARDFRDVLSDLRDAGLPVRDDFFTPHFEFRFPLHGRTVVDGIEVELRQAIEPWHVLGEEATVGGTARYVDSAVERVQIRVHGMTDTRHVVACNGRRVPLHPTDTVGTFVAGVRFKAWQPPSGLHPNIGVHAPLVFDVLDTWKGRSLGGCTYHVVHPGGRAFDDFPTNGLAAESRRAARFAAMGHTPGPVSAPPEERNPRFPLTLDLRRPPAAAV